jgi:serine O-acetyltransferase
MSHPTPTQPPHATSLGHVVEALCLANETLASSPQPPHVRREFPSRAVIYELVEDLRSVLFPGFFGPSELTGETLRFHVGATLDKVLHGLRQQIKRGLCVPCSEAEWLLCDQCDAKAFDLAQAFVARLPEVRRILATDVQAAYEGDPALTNPDEAIFCYPGLMAITSQRIAHELTKLGVPLIPRIITEHAHSLTGIDIHPGARIGEKFFIDHGTGVVIGETCEIGDHVKLYQGVTLGALSFDTDTDGTLVRGVKRHPTLEDRVVIYANATVLGGKTVIGHDSVIGSSVWLTRSVAPYTTVLLEKPNLRMRADNPEELDPAMNYRI